jgi:uncharacterized protein YbaR (Trm112 family)
VYRRSVDRFACLKCKVGSRLVPFASENNATEEIVQGKLICTNCGVEVPIVRCLPRFVPSESYASSFGFQWNRFDELQVDAVMHNDLARDRFYATTGWPTHMEGHVILEAGCGAGRFTQIALETGAEIVSFDLSVAIEAASRNDPIPAVGLRLRSLIPIGTISHAPQLHSGDEALKNVKS